MLLESRRADGFLCHQPLLLPPKYQNRRSPPANAQLTLQDPILPRKRDEVTGIIKLYQSLHEHIYVNADFDTIGKSPIQPKMAEKGQKTRTSLVNH